MKEIALKKKKIISRNFKLNQIIVAVNDALLIYSNDLLCSMHFHFNVC